MTIGALRLADLAADLGLRTAANGFDGFMGAANALRTELRSVRAALAALADDAAVAG